MILWLNGPFGVGKTVTARALAERMTDARIVDPERIGYLIRRTLWRGVDYQDVAAWRRLTRCAVTLASRRGPVVVPMTVLRRDVFEELTHGARVFALVASPETMARRIAGGDEARRWRSQHLDRGLAAFATAELGEPVPTDGRTPEEVADAIMERL